LGIQGKGRFGWGGLQNKDKGGGDIGGEHQSGGPIKVSHLAKERGPHVPRQGEKG